MLQVSYAESGKDYFVPTKGGKAAIIVGICELGTTTKRYKGETEKQVTEIRIIYEVTDYQDEKEVIGLVGQNYSIVVNDKSNLGKVLNAVMGVKSLKEIKNLSIGDLLGKKCFVEIDLAGKDNNFPKVTSVSGYSPSIKYNDQQKESFYFGMSDFEHYDEDILRDPEILPKWEAERIVSTPEFLAMAIKYELEIPEFKKNNKDEESEDDKLNKDLQSRPESEEISIEKEPF